MHWLTRRFQHLRFCSRWGWGVLALGWSVLCNADVIVTHLASEELQKKWNGWWHPEWSWTTWAIGVLVIAVVMIWEGSYRHSDGLGAKIEELEAQLRAVKEELADRYPRLRGEIKLAYLDLGAHCYKGRIYNSHGPCVLTLYVELVNHSKEIAIPHLPPSLKLRINGRDYPGEYVIPEPNLLRMNDSNLKGDSTILDLFSFSMGGVGRGVFQKAYLRGGWLMFNLPEDSQNQLEGHPNISGDVTVTIKDTLGKEHPISRSAIDFGLNKMS